MKSHSTSPASSAVCQNSMPCDALMSAKRAENNGRRSPQCNHTRRLSSKQSHRIVGPWPGLSSSARRFGRRGQEQEGQSPTSMSSMVGQVPCPMSGRLTPQHKPEAPVRRRAVGTRVGIPWTQTQPCARRRQTCQ
eukprot:scaffold94615_cov60-Phaeocystis_antarctica.AAC.2